MTTGTCPRAYSMLKGLGTPAHRKCLGNVSALPLHSQLLELQPHFLSGVSPTGLSGLMDNPYFKDEELCFWDREGWFFPPGTQHGGGRARTSGQTYTLTPSWSPRPHKSLLQTGSSSRDQWLLYFAEGFLRPRSDFISRNRPGSSILFHKCPI